jgi:hypothetical protein
MDDHTTASFFSFASLRPLPLPLRLISYIGKKDLIKVNIECEQPWDIQREQLNAKGAAEDAKAQRDKVMKITTIYASMCEAIKKSASVYQIQCSRIMRISNYLAICLSPK